MSKLTIILDAGHGKETPGKRSPQFEDGSQLFEWKFNREVCLKIKELVSSEFKCIIINEDDTDYRLSTRAEMINNICEQERENGQIPIMISVHGNAASSDGNWKNATGWEVYSTPGKTNSDKLASCFCEAFKEVFPDKKLRGHKEAKFTIIQKTNCPCVLTENFFYDNMEECRYMLSEEGVYNIALLHVQSIKKYEELIS